MFSFHSVHRLETPKLLLAFKNIVTILILVEKAYEDIKIPFCFPLYFKYKIMFHICDAKKFSLFSIKNNAIKTFKQIVYLKYMLSSSFFSRYVSIYTTVMKYLLECYSRQLVICYHINNGVMHFLSWIAA